MGVETVELGIVLRGEQQQLGLQRWWQTFDEMQGERNQKMSPSYCEVRNYKEGLDKGEKCTNGGGRDDTRVTAGN